MPPNCGSPHKKAAHGWMMGFPTCSDDTSTLGKTTGSAKLDASSKKNWYSPEWSEPPSGPKCICYWHQKTSTATPDEESLPTSSETKRIGAGVHWRLLNLKIAWSLPYPNHGLGDFVAKSRREGNPGIAKAFLVLLQAQVPAREWAWLRKASISSSMAPCWSSQWKTLLLGKDHAVCEVAMDAKFWFCLLHGPAWGLLSRCRGEVTLCHLSLAPLGNHCHLCKQKWCNQC